MTSRALAVFKISIKIKTLNTIELSNISTETVTGSRGGEKPHVCHTQNEILAHVLLGMSSV